jgi:hypothetical protein
VAPSEGTRERAPFDGAAARNNNHGNVLQVLGGRGDYEALRRAVAAFGAPRDEKGCLAMFRLMLGGKSAVA